MQTSTHEPRAVSWESVQMLLATDLPVNLEELNKHNSGQLKKNSLKSHQEHNSSHKFKKCSMRCCTYQQGGLPTTHAHNFMAAAGRELSSSCFQNQALSWQMIWSLWHKATGFQPAGGQQWKAWSHPVSEPYRTNAVPFWKAIGLSWNKSTLENIITPY